MDEPTKKTPAEEAKDQARAAKVQHDEKALALQAKAKEPASPKTSEVPPTPQELAFLDRLRKIKQFSRNALMLNLLLDRQVQGRDLVNGVYGIIEHQENQDQFAQRIAQQTGRDLEKVRATIADLTKSTEEGEDELRGQIAELRSQARERNVRLDERIDFLDHMIVMLYMFLREDRSWQDTPRLHRRRKNRPSAPNQPTREKYLADNARTEDLPDRLRAAAEATVDLATRVAAAGAKDCEACEREPIAPAVLDAATASGAAVAKNIADYANGRRPCGDPDCLHARRDGQSGFCWLPGGLPRRKDGHGGYFCADRDVHTPRLATTSTFINEAKAVEATFNREQRLRDEERKREEDPS